MNGIENCILTGAPVITPNISLHEASYSIKLFDKFYTFHFCVDSFNNKDLRKHSHIIKCAILNGLLPEITTKLIHWGCNHNDGIDLKEELLQISYPKTPKDKLENLIKYLHNLQNYDGETLNINNIFDSIWNYNYFKNREECNLYFETLEQNKYITLTKNQSNIIRFKFTYEGLSYLIKISDESYLSKKCFVAMAFDDETKSIREAIRKAILDTDYDPIILDEKHIASDSTINDAIISNIRQCKFCIADFTLHRNGVYFESGFALGLGKPVIYLCRKKDFDEAHFDIKPLQHIIYETEEELTRKLTDKITAWII